MTQAFDPKFMKVGVLTAALQDLTPREVRVPDPDRAIEEWVEFARELGADYIQLSAALHPTETDVPPEAMLDPVANTLDLRKPFDKERAARVRRSLEASKVGLSDVGYFDNLLHHDPQVRKKKHDFMLRTFDAAALLGVDAVCGFVGRNAQSRNGRELRDGRDFVLVLERSPSQGVGRIPRTRDEDEEEDEMRHVGSRGHRIVTGHSRFASCARGRW
jgi:sugar phosphate isomerase/epimerase